MFLSVLFWVFVRTLCHSGQFVRIFTLFLCIFYSVDITLADLASQLLERFVSKMTGRSQSSTTLISALSPSLSAQSLCQSLLVAISSDTELCI